MARRGPDSHRVSQVNEEMLWELMLQGGPVVNVFIPKDKLTNQHMGCAHIAIFLNCRASQIRRSVVTALQHRRNSVALTASALL